MITIKADTGEESKAEAKSQKYVLSELVQKIKTDHPTVWKKGCDGYLMRMNGQTFDDMAALVTALAKYVTAETGKSSAELARHRGVGPGQYSAITLPPVDRTKVKADDVAPIALLMTTRAVGTGVSNKSAHNTDPETASPKTNAVTVSEFYINGVSGRRATMRTEGQKITFYYSASHAHNTYQYARLT